jgi:hypothetical protein
MGRLFRRVVRTARGPRRVKRASAIRGADGRQYRVVAVDENENNEFADPPRKWGRVGILAGAWALALALGGWAAPGIAASGNPEIEDPRDEPSADAINAATRYLRFGTSTDPSRADDLVCDGASPDVSVDDLQGLRQSYAESLNGISDTDAGATNPVDTGDGILVEGTVEYISGDERMLEYFTITVEEQDGIFCVRDAKRVQEDGSEPSSDSTSAAGVEPSVLASNFVGFVVGIRNTEDPISSQCSDFTGITPEELLAAVDAWESGKGDAAGYVLSSEPVDSEENSITMFDVTVQLDADPYVENFEFRVGVQGDCVKSLEGGDGLM